MQILNRYIPTVYAGVIGFYLVAIIVDGSFGAGFELAFDKWMATLAVRLFHCSCFFSSLYIVFTVVQLAVLDLHHDKQHQFVEEKARLSRLVLSCFYLQLPPLAAFVTSQRYYVQRSEGLGFVNDGSIVYFISLILVLWFYWMWQASYRRGSI